MEGSSTYYGAPHVTDSLVVEMDAVSGRKLHLLRCCTCDRDSRVVERDAVSGRKLHLLWCSTCDRDSRVVERDAVSWKEAPLATVLHV